MKCFVTGAAGLIGSNLADRLLGFNGTDFQVRDCFHPRDLVPLIRQQMSSEPSKRPRDVNLGGGPENTMSLAPLTTWCARRFGEREMGRDLTPRMFDLPWVVMDSTLAETAWRWRAGMTLESILEEIATQAQKNPQWLEILSLG